MSKFFQGWLNKILKGSFFIEDRDYRDLCILYDVWSFLLKVEGNEIINGGYDEIF